MSFTDGGSFGDNAPDGIASSDAVILPWRRQSEFTRNKTNLYIFASEWCPTKTVTMHDSYTKTDDN